MESNLSAARFFSRKVESDLDCCRRVCRAPEVKEERELIKESSARFRLPRLTNKRFALSFRQSKKIGRFAIIASWGGSLPPSIFVFPSSRFRQQFLCIMFISTVHRALHLASRVRYLSPPDPIQSIHPSNSTYCFFFARLNVWEHLRPHQNWNELLAKGAGQKGFILLHLPHPLSRFYILDGWHWELFVIPNLF